MNCKLFQRDLGWSAFIKQFPFLLIQMNTIDVVPQGAGALGRESAKGTPELKVSRVMVFVYL